IVSRWPPKRSSAPAALSMSAASTLRPLKSNPSPSSAATRTWRPSLLLIVAWWGFTARSATWMMLPASRPRVIVSPGSAWSRTICLPVFVVAMRRRMKLIVRASPVEEDADDMRRQRRDQREGQRHMHIEPDFEQRPDAKMLAQPGQRRLLLRQKPDDLFAHLRLAAARRRQGAMGGRGRAIAVTPAQPGPDAARERILVERREHRG